MSHPAANQHLPRADASLTLATVRVMRVTSHQPHSDTLPPFPVIHLHSLAVFSHSSSFNQSFLCLFDVVAFSFNFLLSIFSLFSQFHHCTF